jgi:ubiquitin carboxyl-terminal hydrolase 48
VKLEEKDEAEDPCNIVRQNGDFVGLTNLGATCYVNSFLQLWFHNPDFRKAIYDWLPCDDPTEKNNSSLEKVYEGGYVPVSPIGQLQLLFALMQFSKRR